MTTNRWRIGSFSMGIILVALGVMMLVSLITKINMFNIIITFWPVIMICLGIEMLLYLFIKKGGNADAKMKYDALSIIFISFILIVSTFFYSVTFIAGTFDSRADMYAAFGIYNKTAYAESGMEFAGANELVVFGGVNSIKAISTTAENIRVDYRAAVNSSDKEYAESIIGDIIKFKGGERAYMLSNIDMFYNNRIISSPIVNCIISLPRGKTLDLSQFNGQFEYDSMVENQIIKP